MAESLRPQASERQQFARIATAYQTADPALYPPATSAQLPHRGGPQADRAVNCHPLNNKRPGDLNGNAVSLRVSLLQLYILEKCVALVNDSLYCSELGWGKLVQLFREK